MGGPYRSPDKPPAIEEERASNAPGYLGKRKSWHTRAIGGSALAAASGGWLHVDVHEHGLAFRGITEVVKFRLHFDDIDAMHYDCDGLLHGPPRVVLVTFEGERIAIPSDLHDLDVVLDALDSAVTRPILARAKEALARGERLFFGPLVLELDGIVLKGKSLDWSALDRVVCERDAIIFHGKGAIGRFGWAKLFDLPHPGALLDVLRMRTRVVLDGLSLRATE
jgi:hypothetical protein